MRKAVAHCPHSLMKILGSVISVFVMNRYIIYTQGGLPWGEGSVVSPGGIGSIKILGKNRIRTSGCKKNKKLSDITGLTKIRQVLKMGHSWRFPGVILVNWNKGVDKGLLWVYYLVMKDMGKLLSVEATGEYGDDRYMKVVYERGCVTYTINKRNDKTRDHKVVTDASNGN